MFSSPLFQESGEGLSRKKLMLCGGGGETGLIPVQGVESQNELGCLSGELGYGPLWFLGRDKDRRAQDAVLALGSPIPVCRWRFSAAPYPNKAAGDILTASLYCLHPTG